jgi:SAM-dependent methyltransferase
MPEMRIRSEGELPLGSDLELIPRLLPLRGARLLELGCGEGIVARHLGETFPIAELIATEVDHAQHRKNLRAPEPRRVRFRYGGAEAIAEPDGSVDAVLMLKSLHHVPVHLMAQGLREIHRVLKPGGLAYVSEPVYAGAFNDILRLFHDERQVREAAFAALREAVAGGLFELVDEVFFDGVSRFAGFGEFEERVLGATHSQFHLDAALHARVERAFLRHVGPDGSAEFRNPHRVDLLRRSP